MAGSDGRSEKEKMLAGVLYRAVGPELAADNLRADRLLRAYNATGAEEVERRTAVLAELLGATGGEWSRDRRSIATTATTYVSGAGPL